MKPKTILAIVIFILLLILTLQNTQTVSFRFLFWTLTLSRILLIPIFILLGFLLGYILAKVEKPSKNQKSS
jgi:putative membrane protein